MRRTRIKTDKVVATTVVENAISTMAKPKKKGCECTPPSTTQGQGESGSWIRRNHCRARPASLQLISTTGDTELTRIPPNRSRKHAIDTTNGFIYHNSLGGRCTHALHVLAVKPFGSQSVNEESHLFSFSSVVVQSQRSSRRRSGDVVA